MIRTATAQQPDGTPSSARRPAAAAGTPDGPSRQALADDCRGTAHPRAPDSRDTPLTLRHVGLFPQAAYFSA